MTVTIEPLGYRSDDQRTGVFWRVHSKGSPSIALEHAVMQPHAVLLPTEDNGDHALLTVLLHAMERGSSLNVEGSVSPKLLDGLERLQAVWNGWRPERYRQVDIQCQSELDRTLVPAKENAAESGLFAYSGGVDSVFTLLRHANRGAGRASVNPKAALFVHGFDIPLSSDEEFQGAYRRAQLMISDYPEIEIIRLRTNSRLITQSWEDSFGLQLAGAFLTVASGFTAAVKGSDVTYDRVGVPWGATPFTMGLLSTEQLTIFEDGNGFDRNEKVAFIAGSSLKLDLLRFCWEGNKADRNCGQCEKCVRTMLGFWVNQLQTPSFVPTPLSPALVRNIRCKNGLQLDYWQSIHELAVQNGLARTKIGRAVRSVLKKSRAGQRQRVIWRKILAMPNLLARSLQKLAKSE